MWEVGYWSTDDEEDNDSDYDPDLEGEEEEEEEGEEEYDEEEEEDEDDEENKDVDKPHQPVDPTLLIKQEKYEKSLQPEERKYLLQVSDIEKKII